jgi:primosomal protein N' (replication factor Y)
MTLYAEIILSLPLDQSFSYVVPEFYQSEVKIGSRVLVPFGQRFITGFIVNLRKRKLTRDIKLKEIKEILDERPVFSPSFLSFTRKLSEYYYTSWGELLQASLPPSYILKSKTEIFLSEQGKVSLQGETLSRDEREFLSFLVKRSYGSLFLKRKFKIKNFSHFLSRLEKKGLIRIRGNIRKVRRRETPEAAVSQTQLEIDFSLDSHSREVSEQITRKIKEDTFSPFFLYGSSEKREAVYFYLIKKVLEKGRSVLFLVPEIALTQRLMERFEKKLGKRVALLHSRLSEKKREREWQKIKNGEVEVVVGARSALFSPLEHPGLIIVDEEQDESYFQQESPSYDARKGGWLRARQEGAILVYGSSFPSVEAFYRAKKRGYVLSLKSEPKKRKVEIIDDRQGRGVISPKILERISAQLVKKEPVLVFFNRRGYASFLFCSRCHYIPRCIHCDITLTYHKREDKVVCHYCNYSLPKMSDCPECGSRIIRERGIGIEAVEEELRRIFSQSRIVCFDTGLNKRDQERILQNFSRQKIDILIGTQLLVHQMDLPPVSLVIILFPEKILALSDYRASQKAFQTLNQMMKFLKDESKAEVMIQTALPHHFSIREAAFGGYLFFFRQELKFRRLMDYPPFSHMVEILFQGENLRKVARISREFRAQVRKHAEDVEILGPALASVPRVRGVYRVQVIIKARRKKILDDVLRKSLKVARLRKSILVYG